MLRLSLAALDPEPISKAILAVTAIALPLLGGMFNNPLKRENAINKELSEGQYMAPTALNLTQSSNGTYADFDSRGNLRNSTFSPYPETTNPFVWANTHGIFGPPPTYYDVPGGTQQPFSPGAAPQIVINMNAIDTQSGVDFIQKNQHVIADATASHLQNVNGRLADAVQYITNTGRHS
jgi:hypothetical protein